ncbi:MAG: hypothetical protein ACOZEN_15230 [Thermodesulfobacteriota bacterium]
MAYVDASPKASSTDKLLEMIRGVGKKGGEGETPPPRPLAPKGKWTLRMPSFKGGPKGGGAKNVRLGVEFSGAVIRMVKLSVSGGRPRTLEYKTIPIPEQGPEAPELSLVLRLALKDFLGKADADIWAMVPAESAELRFLQVPKTGKKQISNAVYWTAKKEAAFDDNEVMFDYELQGEVMEKGAPKLAVLAYTVKREEFEKLRSLFMQAGYPLAGITVPSVAVRNLLRGGWIENGAQTQACLHLGGDFSRLEIFGGGNLQFVRVLKGGLASMAQALSDASKEYRPPAPETPPAAEQGEAVAVVPEEPLFSTAVTVEIESMGPPEPEPEPAGMTPDEARALLDSLAAGSEPLPEGHPGRALSPSDVLEMLKPAWERLLRQVQMTFSHHSVTLGNEQVARLSLSGPLGGDPGLLEYLGGKLGVPCIVLDPLSPENLGRLSVASPQLTLAERQPYGLVLGLTDSDRAACNLLYTYKQKEEEARVQNLNKLVALCWLGVAAVVAGFFVWQQTQAYLKQQDLRSLEERLREFQPQVDMPLLLSTGSKVRGTVDNLRRFAARNLASALLRDITELTPENVKLYSVSIDLGNPEEQPAMVPEEQPKPGQRGQAKKKAREGMDTLTLEGFVKGDSQILESLLSAYLVRLRTSPLLGEPSVSKRSPEVAPSGEDMLRFTLTCQVRR